MWGGTPAGGSDASAYYRQLSSRLIGETQNGVMITAVDGTIQMVNPAFTQMTGYEPEEVIGKKPNLLKSGRQGPDFYAKMWESLNTTGKWQGEIWNRKKNGEPYLEWLSLFTLSDEGGRPLHRVAIFSDITAARRDTERLRHLAYHDPLTGLPNRYLFDDRLQQAIRRARRKTTHAGVLYVDLDGFKPVNDRYGHAAGDDTLIHVGRTLQMALRLSDTVCRLGGDEFAVVLEDCSPEKTIRIAEKVLALISAPFHIGSIPCEISASVGVAVFPDDGEDASVLTRHADEAMYRAKFEGGHRVRRWSRSPAPSPTAEGEAA